MKIFEDNPLHFACVLFLTSTNLFALNHHHSEPRYTIQNDVHDLPWHGIDGAPFDNSKCVNWTKDISPGDFICNLEWNEWALVDAFIKPHHSVIEFGARYGTTSCQIARAQGNSGKLVAVEPSATVQHPLRYAQNIHNCNFHILNGTIAKKPLALDPAHWAGGVFAYGQSTRLGESNVQNFRLKEVEEKFGMKFNAAVIDCEGCIEFIEEELFHQVDLVILEDEGAIARAKKFSMLTEAGLHCVWMIADGWSYVVKDLKHSVWIRGNQNFISCEEYSQKLNLKTHDEIICEKCPD